MKTPKLCEAFGEKHSVFDWSLDSRCCVSWNTLRQRIKYRWSMERALSQPARRFIDQKTKREINEAFAEGSPVSEVVERFGVSRSMANALRTLSRDSRRVAGGPGGSEPALQPGCGSW